MDAPEQRRLGELARLVPEHHLALGREVDEDAVGGGVDDRVVAHLGGGEEAVEVEVEVVAVERVEVREVEEEEGRVRPRSI